MFAGRHTLPTTQRNASSGPAGLRPLRHSSDAEPRAHHRGARRQRGGAPCVSCAATHTVQCSGFQVRARGVSVATDPEHTTRAYRPRVPRRASHARRRAAQRRGAAPRPRRKEDMKTSFAGKFPSPAPLCARTCATVPMSPLISPPPDEVWRCAGGGAPCARAGGGERARGAAEKEEADRRIAPPRVSPWDRLAYESQPLRKRLPARFRSLRPWGPSWGTVHA